MSLVSKKRKTLKLKHERISEAFLPPLPSLNLGVCKRDKKTGSSTGSAQPLAEPEAWSRLCGRVDYPSSSTHRNSSYGRVQKHNTLQSALSTFVCAGREGLARREWLGGRAGTIPKLNRNH